MAENLAAFLEHYPSGFGQLNMTIVALEKRLTDRLLELRDSATQGGLGDVQALGGASEVQTFCDRDQGAKVAYFNAH
ncbi:hypothetical protein BJB45_13575 [Halomonas huangheensis]|uniref:Uncharacterized protein n=1 Tax=Halomonas huangheensis TaxID=1178482 RepID=W1N7F7_9GAMM|nr:hypothetical protein BJB45_13575 [Halomonas huangheensis]